MNLIAIEPVEEVSPRGALPAPWQLHLIILAGLRLSYRVVMKASAALYCTGSAIESALSAFEACWDECLQRPELDPAGRAEPSTTTLVWHSVAPAAVLAIFSYSFWTGLRYLFAP